jgi:hypothetical protein
MEHNHGEKTPDWFWSVGIIAVAGAILAIYFSNLLFALVILLGAFTSIMASHTPPRLLKYEIGRRGVKVGDTLYPFSTLESFWVIDEEIDDRIIIKSEKFLMPYIVVPFDSTETGADDIRDYLLDYINEEELHEPAAQKIMERLGF